jgi:hypothetical protein
MHLFVQIFAQDFFGIEQPRIERQDRVAVRDLIRRHPQMPRVFEAADIVALAPALDAFDDLFGFGLRQREINRSAKFFGHRAVPLRWGAVLSQDAADANAKVGAGRR